MKVPIVEVSQRKLKEANLKSLVQVSNKATNLSRKGSVHPALKADFASEKRDFEPITDDNDNNSEVGNHTLFVPHHLRNPVSALSREVKNRIREAQTKLRSGKGFTTVSRLKKSLDSMQKKFSPLEVSFDLHHEEKKDHRRRHIADRDAAKIVANSETYMQILESNLANPPHHDDNSDESDEISLHREGSKSNGDYMPGMEIYYGTTIAFQARHGGFLSYKNNEVKASAHKVLSHTCFVVKNSSDLSDVREMKYGDALWFVISVFSFIH